MPKKVCVVFLYPYERENGYLKRLVLLLLLLLLLLKRFYYVP